jgi:hypothetical protein
VTAVLSKLNAWMWLMLIVAYLPVMTVAASHDGGSWDTRMAASAVLAVSGAVIWWHARALPRGSHTVLLAALRGDRNLMVFYGVLMLGLLAYVAIAVTGRAPYIQQMWNVVILTIVFAIVGFISARRDH